MRAWYDHSKETIVLVYVKKSVIINQWIKTFLAAVIDSTFKCRIFIWNMTLRNTQVNYEEWFMVNVILVFEYSFISSI